MAPLTPEEHHRTLALVQTMLECGREVSLSLVARELGCSKSAAKKRLDALREQGLLRGPRTVGFWALTASGKKSLLRA